MAERRLQSSSFGHPGRLTFSSFGDEQAEEWGWHYARNHDPNAPRFETIASPQEWFAGSHHVDALPAGRTWHVAQQQKKWLLKNHPEAALGNDILDDILSPEISGRNTSKRSHCQLTQLAIGEMADLRTTTTHGGVPLIAMAAGSASDVLRFIRPKLEGWAHNGNGATLFHLMGHGEAQEAFWMQETGVILRIKTVVSLKRFEPIRWLLVQRHTGTSVFRPEYQKAPVVSETFFSGDGVKAPSYVNPNLLFTVPKHLTGCDSHSDVSFNPGIRAQPLQLAIIDEGGRWTIWDIMGTRSRVNKRPKKHLVKCGSIRNGVRNSIAQRPSVKPQWHRVCWIGNLVDEFDGGSDDEGSSDEQARSAYPPLERSSTLLFCNRETLRILDLNSDTFLPDLPLLAEGSNDRILDVHVDSGDSRYFFVATTTTLFVCGLFSANDPSSPRVVKKALILHSTRHLRDTILRDLQLAVSPGPYLTNQRTSLVYLYSSSSNWVDVFCINKSKNLPERVTCHRDMLILNGPGENKLRLQTLCLSPVLATPRQKNTPTTEDRLFANLTRRYYQIFFIGTDLSLSCVLGLSSGSKSTPRLLLVEGSDDLIPKNHRQRALIRSLAARFIAPDALEEFRYRIEGLHIAAGDTVKPSPPKKIIRRRMKQFHDLLRQTSFGLLHMHDNKDADMDIYGAAPFDPVYVIAQEAVETRMLPLKTLLQVVQEVKLPEDLEEASREWQAEIEGLRSTNPGLQVTNIARPHQAARPEHERSLLEISSELSSLVEGRNPYSIEHGMTPILLRSMACDSFLSSFGIMFQDTTTFEGSEPTSQDIRSSPAGGDSMLLDSQMSGRSATPMSSAPTQQAQAEPVSAEDRAMALIRAYTGSGKTTLQKPAQRTSTWIVGHNPADHVWSVNINTEVTEGMIRMAKHQNKQATKRKRAETLLRLEFEAEQERKRKAKSFRSTQPVPDTKFFSSQASQPSQPLQESSQPPNATIRPSAVSMSQPVPGVFGARLGLDRPKKKPKRKGGF